MDNQETVVSVVIPAYNEHEAMAEVLQSTIAAMDTMDIPYEVIVVDDGSTDDTCEICARFPCVQVISHDRNRGTGAARTTGVKAARGQLIMMIDADGTYPSEAIPPMLKELETCDMVIGAREREMGTLKLLRSAAKEFIRHLACYLTQTHIPDLNSGMRAMRRDRVLEFVRILPNTHSWVSTITLAMLSSDYRVRWMPIAYHKRIGHSTFHPIRDTYNYLSLVVRAIMYFNPLRVFLPLSLSMLGIGAIKAIYDIFAYQFHFAPSTLMLIFTALQLGAIGLLADLIVRRSRL